MSVPAVNIAPGATIEHRRLFDLSRVHVHALHFRLVRYLESRPVELDEQGASRTLDPTRLLSADRFKHFGLSPRSAKILPPAVLAEFPKKAELPLTWKLDRFRPKIAPETGKREMQI